MERFYGYKLGQYAGREYSLSVSGAPDINDVEEFAVTVHYYDTDTDETIEIARIDTAHGVTHFDKLFRRDQPKEQLDSTISTLNNDSGRTGVDMREVTSDSTAIDSSARKPNENRYST